MMCACSLVVIMGDKSLIRRVYRLITHDNDYCERSEQYNVLNNIISKQEKGRGGRRKQ